MRVWLDRQQGLLQTVFGLPICRLGSRLKVKFTDC